MKKYPVVKQAWLESERGWGQRPDGYSYHLTNEDLEKFVKAYEKKLPDEVPDCYSRPSGSPTIVSVDITAYNEIKKSKYGIRA